MAYATPFVSNGRLTVQEEAHEIAVESPEWWRWLDVPERKAFRFRSEHGNFTAHQVQVNGSWYWKAYRKYNGSLYRLYLGKAEQLTLEHLQTAARTLAQRSERSPQKAVLGAELAQPAETPVSPLLASAQAAASAELQQPDAFLLTKLHVPPPLVQTILRPRLLARLSQAIHHSLTLLSAPAGFGKTTALSTWAQQTSQRIAWLALDGDDNTVRTFLASILASLDAAGVPLSAELRFRRFSSPRALMILLLNELQQLPYDLILVLDDYHLLSAPAVQSALLFLFERLPAQVHLLIATRTDPPFPLARLRARHRLLEIRTAELRFTQAEAEMFFTRRIGRALSSHELATLDSRLEGWIAGLQLTALSLQESQDLIQVLATLTGKHRYITDFLTEEVFVQQPAEIQDFLLQTSILTYLTASLCNAVTGRTDGQAMLERLEQANLFLVPLDEERRAYRYHHLFAEFLRQRMHTMRPAELPRLHLSVSYWYEEQHALADAVTHALAAAAYTRAAELLERIMGALWMEQKIYLLLNWLEHFPQEFLRTRPLLCFYLALLSYWLYEPLETRMRWLSYAEQGLAALETLPVEMQESLFALRVASLFFQERMAETVTYALQGLEGLPLQSPWRGVVLLFLGGASFYCHTTEQGIRHFQAALLHGELYGTVVVILYALCNLAEMTMLQGRLQEAAELYQQAVQRYSMLDNEHILPPAYAYTGLSLLLYEWNEREQAFALIQQGYIHAEKRGQLFLLEKCIFQARILFAMGDEKAGLTALARADELVAHHLPRLTRLYIYHLHLWLQQGRLQEVQKRLQVRSTEKGPPFYENQYTMYARLYLAQGNYQAVLELLPLRLELMRKHGYVSYEIEFLLLQALAWQGMREESASLQAVQQALMLAEPAGFLRLFIDEGEPMRLLLLKLHASLQKGRSPQAMPALSSYIERLLAGFAPSRQPVLFRSSLSEREIEVLHLMERGLSNKEIAQQLVLSEGTIKTHAKRIYGKLHVSNRTQAIRQARNQHIL